MKAIPQEGQELNFKYEPHHSAGEIHMTKPTGMSPNAVSELIEDFCQGDSELAKYLYVFCRTSGSQLIVWLLVV